jgi:hypothetical protein
LPGEEGVGSVGTGVVVGCGVGVKDAWPEEEQAARSMHPTARKPDIFFIGALMSILF